MVGLDVIHVYLFGLVSLLYLQETTSQPFVCHLASLPSGDLHLEEAIVQGMVGLLNWLRTVLTLTSDQHV